MCVGEAYPLYKIRPTRAGPAATGDRQGNDESRNTTAAMLYNPANLGLAWPIHDWALIINVIDMNVDRLEIAAGRPEPIRRLSHHSGPMRCESMTYRHGTQLVVGNLFPLSHSRRNHRRKGSRR